VVLELFRPTSRIIGTLVNTWLAVVSRIFASGASTEYRYLRRSVANTVTATDFITMAEGIGFSVCRSSFFLPAATCVTLKKEQHA
jgi:ubiquinone/menaquinone biosynthesis C-methylase UbiE